MALIGSVTASSLSGSVAFDSLIGLSGSLDIVYDGTGTEDGYLQMTEMSAPGNPAANKGRLYVADNSGTTSLYFKDAAGTATNLVAGGGTDRYSITHRFRTATMTNGTFYFTDDVDASANQFYMSKTVTSGSTPGIDSDWFSGFEGGPQWMAHRDCTLTNICATSRINANASLHTVRIHIFKGTPVQAQTYSTDIALAEVGVADLTEDGSTTLTDYELLFVNKAVSANNSISANDCVFIVLEPIGANAAASYFQVTMEFTVS